MWTREADASDAVDSGDALEELGEVAGRIVRSLVVIDDLTKQLHFPAPLPCGFADLGDDVGRWPHALVPTGVRHDAEGTELVAPFDDRDPCAHRIGMASDAERERHVLVRIDVDLPPP